MAGAPKGNTNAKKGALFMDQVRRACAQEDFVRLRAAAEQLLDQAAAGEQWAIRELIDRFDGKAAQSLTLSGDSENPLTVMLTDAAKLRAKLVDAIASTNPDPGH